MCKIIKEMFVAKGYDTSFIADIYFASKVAMMVVECFDKICVNFGNFVDGCKMFENILYEMDEEYNVEFVEIEEIFMSFVLKCKERGVAMRIGMNYGFLFVCMLLCFGDMLMGMVEFVFEFVCICCKYDYYNFVFFMKAFNFFVMV